MTNMANELLCEENLDEIYSNNNNSPSPKKEHFEPEIDEETKSPVRAVKDSKLLKDGRILKNLLKLEKVCVPVSEDYLRSGIQPDLNPSYRKIVTDWMLQVS